jgi:hypothetical protein
MVRVRKTSLNFASLQSTLGSIAHKVFCTVLRDSAKRKPGHYGSAALRVLRTAMPEVLARRQQKNLNSPDIYDARDALGDSGAFIKALLRAAFGGDVLFSMQRV